MLSVHSGAQLVLNNLEYLEAPDFNVFVFTDNYPEGHQGGIQIIQHDVRVASNGDLWLEPAPGQWSPFSKVDGKKIDTLNQTITVSLSYPNKTAAERKFNPITYPDLEFSYSIVVKATGDAFSIIVNLDKALPKEWRGRVSFNLELFPGDLFGKNFFMDGRAGIFPMQLNGPFEPSFDSFESVPLAEGHELVLAPGTGKQMLSITSDKNIIQLTDGRAHHNNGWFIVRSPVPGGATIGAIEWIVTAKTIGNWKYLPVIHINQVGYLTNQAKVALIECDKEDSLPAKVELLKLLPTGEWLPMMSKRAIKWGQYQRYAYYKFDYSAITDEGVYALTCGTSRSEQFRIGSDIYERNAWQPTLEYFLPVQMCHMRVNDRYRVWHGLCHMDDARMAPTDCTHFDGYMQGSSTLTSFKPAQHVPGLNTGGWHDAGDFDLRVESQTSTMHSLSLIYETFGIEYDNTTINQVSHMVEMHMPDGKPDILQQIEHGALSVVNGYKSLGRLYRGIICNDLKQYVTLGDASVITNNVVFEPDNSDQLPGWFENTNDDRWVFTEINSRRELKVCAGLAAAARVLKGYNDTLSEQCLQIAEIILKENEEDKLDVQRIEALTELVLTTGKEEYLSAIIALETEVVQHVKEVAWSVSRVLDRIEDNMFRHGFMLAMQQYYFILQQETASNPFGVPYKPQTWGAAWNIEHFGMEHYFLYKNLQNEDSKQYVLNALNYVLGIHPGANTSSFVSGVGTRSATVAYGLNRDDWSYIPGGVISGTATIKPDFPELKEWPYLWQQSEYMISGAAENFMFLVMAAIDLVE